MERFGDLTRQQCEEVNGGGVLSAAAGGILGFIVGSVAATIKIATTGNDKGTAKILFSCVTVGAWLGSGFPAP